MRGHVIVDGVGEDSVVAVEEEDDDKGEYCRSTDLGKRPNL